MSDQPVREPIEPDPRRDRDVLPDEGGEEERSAPPVRPSKAEGAEETGGTRPPRPSQAEGERGTTDQ